MHLELTNKQDIVVGGFAPPVLLFQNTLSNNTLMKCGEIRLRLGFLTLLYCTFETILYGVLICYVESGSGICTFLWNGLVSRDYLAEGPSGYLWADALAPLAYSSLNKLSAKGKCMIER